MQRMSKICQSRSKSSISARMQFNIWQNFVQIIFKICSQWPALVQVYLVAPIIPRLNWEVATTSVTYQSVSSSRTDESVVSMARHCRGQQTRNPAPPQPSSGCRATQSMQTGFHDLVAADASSQHNFRVCT